ncbi:hypothetical protein RRSWK_02691 [Rhodopirellula sp. SWK7]|nr:hypothetical protein RRSWK_02691 [Rhodopirellula sp. SWK7]
MQTTSPIQPSKRSAQQEDAFAMPTPEPFAGWNTGHRQSLLVNKTNAWGPRVCKKMCSLQKVIAAKTHPARKPVENNDRTSAYSTPDRTTRLDANRRAPAQLRW